MNRHEFRAAARAPEEPPAVQDSITPAAPMLTPQRPVSPIGWALALGGGALGWAALFWALR